MNDKYKFISAIMQLVCAVILLGISVYYYFAKHDVSAFLLFLIVGIIFILLPIRTIYKLRKQNKDEEDKK